MEHRRRLNRDGHSSAAGLGRCKREAYLHSALRVRQNILQPRQVAQLIDSLERRGLLGQAHAIDEVWRAACHGPRIIGVRDPPLSKRIWLQVVVFEVHSWPDPGLDLAPIGALCWSALGCRSPAVSPDVEETRQTRRGSARLGERAWHAPKRSALHALHPEDWVIGSDQVAVLGETDSDPQILGKPGNTVRLHPPARRIARVARSYF